MEIFQGMAKALLATIIIEEIAVLFWKERTLRLFLCVLLANVVTNPTINLIVHFAPDVCFASRFRYYSMILILEAFVWLSETWAFWRFGDVKPLKRSMLFSLTLNGVSYLSGFPLDALGYWD